MDRHRGHGAERDDTGEIGDSGNTGQPYGCAAFGPLLEAFYHHALNPEQARSVAEHAAGCVLCGAALEHLSATDRLIADAPTTLPGAELRQRVAARIATARAHRSADAATPVPTERKTFVNDVNDSQWTETTTQPTRSNNGMQRMRVLVGTAAAVLIVALLAGALLTRPHGPAAGGATATLTPGYANQTGTATPDHTSTAPSGQFAEAAGTCNPTKISAHMPLGALLIDIAMVSPNEGWAVGAIESSNGPTNTVALHYQNCVWTPVSTNFAEMTLMSVSMVSATEGWAVGGSTTGKQLALHYTGGAWQSVTLPGENTFVGVYTLVRMRSADEGWIVVTHSKNQQGMLTQNLLHLAHGSWSAVSAPFKIVNDIVPVSQDEAWMAGYASDGEVQPVLYHYRAGSWTSFALPPGVAVDRLRMVSPDDIWASGHINASTNADYDQSAAVLNYDGNSWHQETIVVPGKPQSVQAFTGLTSWAFSISKTTIDDTIVGVQYLRGASWLTVKWPFSDMNLGLVSFGMNTIQRVSTDEYWTIGVIGGSQSVLLYFANGMWHQYGG